MDVIDRLRRQSKCFVDRPFFVTWLPIFGLAENAQTSKEIVSPKLPVLFDPAAVNHLVYCEFGVPVVLAPLRGCLRKLSN